MLVDEDDLKKGGFSQVQINKSLFDISFDSLKVVRVIAAGGSTAVVYQVGYKGKDCALKLFKTKDISSQRSYNMFEKEVQILREINHPNTLEFFGCVLNEPRVGVLMEYCPNEDLRAYISKEKHDRLSFSNKFRMLCEIANIMAHLNSRGIIHRDLKNDTSS